MLHQVTCDYPLKMTFAPEVVNFNALRLLSDYHKTIDNTETEIIYDKTASRVCDGETEILVL